MLEPALLLLMQHGPAHGYTLLNQIEEFGFRNIDPSLVYRAMRQMEVQGLVTSAWDDTETQGPPRRVYHLTSSGNDVLDKYIGELKGTRGMIDRILDAYNKHTSGSKG